MGKLEENRKLMQENTKLVKENTKILLKKMNMAPKNYEQEGKHRMSELPLDLISEMLCPAYLEGSDKKYYRYSWRKGFKISVMMDACLRHLDKFFNKGENYDQETLSTFGIRKHHLGAAMFCIVSMYNDWCNHPHNDDRPSTDFYNPEKDNAECMDKVFMSISELKDILGFDKDKDISVEDIKEEIKLLRKLQGNINK
jgi:hypothetical protein